MRKIIYILPLIFLFSFKNNNVSKSGIPYQDSLVLKKYLHDFESDLFDVYSVDSIPEDSLNMLIEEYRYLGSEGRFISSSDSIIKFYTILSEFCGAYCNPSWETFIHVKYNDTVLVYDQYDLEEIGVFYNIENIYKLPNNNYLIIQYSWGRPFSVMSVICGEAFIIEIKNGHILKHKIEFHINKDGLNYCQPHWAENTPYIEYDTIKRLLEYRFTENNMYYDGQDIDSTYKGVLEFQNGNFHLVNENINVLNRDSIGN